MVMETNDCTFTLLTEQNILSLEPFFLQYAYGICDNTIGAVYQWRNIYVSYFAVVDHCLCIRANYGEYGDCYTVPIGCGDFDRAFDCIECDAEKNHIPLRFCVVPEEALGVLRDRYGERVRAESIRDWADYLYDANAFRTYSGKQLHTQKNHVNRFWREHPNAVCAIVNTPEIEQTAQAFLDEYVAQHPVASGNGMIDTSKLFVFFIIAGSLALLGALVVICSDTMRGVASLMYAMFFILLSMGIALIGLGVSISRK